MASFKPRSKSDRMPVQYPGQKQPSRDVRGGDAGAVLTLTPLTEAERDARTVRALLVLESYGALDLADMLGLAAVPERVADAGQLDVPCPQCTAQPGVWCTAESGEPYRQGHRGRHRRAQELREAMA